MGKSGVKCRNAKNLPVIAQNTKKVKIGKHKYMLLLSFDMPKIVRTNIGANPNLKISKVLKEAVKPPSTFEKSIFADMNT